MLAGGAEGRDQRIAGPDRRLKVFDREHDAFRLDHDFLLAALDVDRSAKRAVLALVWHDRVRLGTGLRFGAKLLDFFERLGDQLFESFDFLLGLLAVVDVLAFERS